MNIETILLYIATITAWIAIVMLAAVVGDLRDKLDSINNDWHRDDTQWVKTIKAYVDVVYETLNVKLNNKKDKK